MRLAVDTGGTFTDLVAEDDDGLARLYKTSSTPQDPIEGVMIALQLAADDRRVSLADFLGSAAMLIHGTTRATNAVITGTTARTALLATKGHRDMLLLREGGRTDTFNWTRPYPDPYVPRALTFEVPERLDAQGNILRPLDEEAVLRVIHDMKTGKVDAVAVCLLWSIVNPVHERRIGELLDEHLPGVPYTLSHVLNPVMREYRRTSSTAIDASLKPLMATYIGGLGKRLHDTGFRGRLLMITASGGVLDGSDMAEAPIHSISSGPSMAPTAGRFYAGVDADSDTAIVADTGGTSYDITLVRRGRIPFTRETWLGPPYFGHMTGFPAVDVKSVGAGGGSIAWLDKGGLLHVGPGSAGADPGPVCYQRGGTRPTVTDACLALGYIDPEYFLGGSMAIDMEAARGAIDEQIARPLSSDVDEAAAAIMTVATELMVQAIEEITVNQGMDPREAVLVGGGGAAGLNAVAIAGRLGCSRVIIPPVGAALSAAGALMSDLATEFSAHFFANSSAFDYNLANQLLSDLGRKCQEFIGKVDATASKSSVGFIAEARYAGEVWQLDLPLRVSRFDSDEAVSTMVQDFHALHEEVYAVRDQRSPVEIINLRARVQCSLESRFEGRVESSIRRAGGASARSMYFSDAGRVDGAVWRLEELAEGQVIRGPAVVESPFSTVVINPGGAATLRPSGSLVLTPYQKSPPADDTLASSASLDLKGS